MQRGDVRDILAERKGSVEAGEEVVLIRLGHGYRASPKCLLHGH